MAERPNGEKLGRIKNFQLLKKSKSFYYLFLAISMLLSFWVCAREVNSDFTLGKPILWIAINTNNVFLQLLTFLLLVLLFFACFSIVFLNRIQNKEYGVIHKKFINLDGLDEYVAILESFYVKKLDKNARVIINNNLAIGYLAFGRFEETGNLLEENLILININYKKVQINGMVAFNNLAELYCQKGDAENAQKYFEKMMAYEPKIKNTLHYEKYIYHKSALEHEINVVSGNFTAADETFFLKDFDKKLPIKKKQSLFYLALIYAKNGDMRKYQECIDRLLVSDKRLHFAKTAENIIKKLATSNDVTDHVK